MYDYFGRRIWLPVAADRYTILTPDVWVGVTNVKIESSKAEGSETTKQTGSRTIYLATQF
jgi:hypothetical protein